MEPQAETTPEKFDDRTSRLDGLEKVFKVIRALCQRRHTLDELGELIGLHPRGVYRYLDLIERMDLGLKVEDAKRKKGQPGRLPLLYSLDRKAVAKALTGKVTEDE